MEEIGRGHAERLAPLVRELMEETGVTAGRLDRIGVVAGPGSFTGVRVGVAFARGLALTLDIPAVGVSALTCAARSADPAREKTVLAAHDARRDELAWQIYERGAAKGEMRLDPVEAVAGQARGMDDFILAGSGAMKLAAALGGGLETAATEPPDPEQAARLAAEAQDLAPPSPIYQRPPDAKLPGGITPP